MPWCHRIPACQRIRTNHRARLVTNCASRSLVTRVTIQGYRPCCVGKTTEHFCQRKPDRLTRHGPPRRSAVPSTPGNHSILYRNRIQTNPHYAGLAPFTHAESLGFIQPSVPKNSRNWRIIGKVRRMDKADPRPPFARARQSRGLGRHPTWSTVPASFRRLPVFPSGPMRQARPAMFRIMSMIANR
jgi:hypothetical protein